MRRRTNVSLFIALVQCKSRNRNLHFYDFDPLGNSEGLQSSPRIIPMTTEELDLGGGVLFVLTYVLNCSELALHKSSLNFVFNSVISLIIWAVASGTRPSLVQEMTCHHICDQAITCTSNNNDLLSMDNNINQIYYICTIIFSYISHFST